MNCPVPHTSSHIAYKKKGARAYTKLSYPIHCGIYSEVSTEDAVFHFNLCGEIIRAKSKGKDWGHPHEWLKRTVGNDWVYYSTGGYAGVFEAIGEYYLPNFAYPTNSMLGGHSHLDTAIREITTTWHETLGELARDHFDQNAEVRRFFAKALANTPQVLAQKAKRLHEIVGGKISVLPPDARHVEYNLIPLTISHGCLYKCRFCKVKNALPYGILAKAEIDKQIASLFDLYGDDLSNYNALFIGEHDALLAGEQCLLGSIASAYRQFNFAESYMSEHRTFFFGSVTSLLQAPERLFADLNQFPGIFHINIGFESADQATLDQLGKPISAKDVEQAFWRMQEINDRYERIEITGNFVMDDGLPATHYPAVMGLIRDRLTHHKPKGSIYFSPLAFGQPSRARLFEFHRLKVLSRLPTFLYIIQRL